MKLYNTGTEMFCFQYGGRSFYMFPKFGTFKKQKESYEVELFDSKNRVKKMTRFRTVWVKTSDEGVNDNFVEADSEHLNFGMKKARDEGREDIKQEKEVIKAEMDKVAAVEKKVKEKEEALAIQEKELNIKLAMLKKVEDEAVSKAASKHR